MILLLVPAALLGIAALLTLTSYLEQRRARVLVRFTVRANTTPEQAEEVIAAELAPILAAEGLMSRRAS